MRGEALDAAVAKALAKLPAAYGNGSTPGIKPVPTAGDTIDPTLPVQFTGSQLDPSQVIAVGEADKGWSVGVVFDQSAASDLATFSRANLGHYLAAVLDHQVVSVSLISAPIENGRMTLFGSIPDESMPIIVGIFKYGALPGTLSLVSYDRSGYHPIPSPTPSAGASAS